MKRSMILCLSLLLSGVCLLGSSLTRVENVSARQLAGTRTVEIRYDLAAAAAAAIEIWLSDDGGASWALPTTSLSGPGYGSAVEPGVGLLVYWDAGVDWPDRRGESLRVRVHAVAPAVLSLSESLNFPATYVGSASTELLTLTNLGDLPLTVSELILPDGFSVDWSGGLLEAGESQNVTVTFAPMLVQEYSETAVITSDANNTTTTVALKAVGLGLSSVFIANHEITRTLNSFPDTSDWTAAVKSELGVEWEVMDWSLLKTLIDNNTDLANSIATLLGGYDASAFVLRNGEKIYSGERHYFATAHFGTVPGHYMVHDQIGGNIISLGSWWSTMPILAVRSTMPPPAPSGFVWVEGGTLSTSNALNGTAVSSFYMGVTEVTWGEWQTVRTWAASNGYDIGSVGAGCADEHPVHSVNWYDVLKWSNAKSEMEGLTPVYTVDGNVYRTGQLGGAWVDSVWVETEVVEQNLSANGYRLPLEAEWEFAARGGNQSNGYTYAGSNDLNEVGWYWDNASGAACNLSSGRGTWPVGQKAANELGLYDMSGNVWEWCWDQSGSFRRIRGGSWSNSADGCTVSLRFNYNPDNRNFNYGFRLARSSGSSPTLEPMQFVYIPSGTFSMGDAFGEGEGWEVPVQTVELSAYAIGSTPVTSGQWQEMRDWALASGLGYTDLPVGFGRDANHPVVNISWLDAVKWLNAWSERDGLQPVYRVAGEVMRSGSDSPVIDYSANGYRLPSEAEWERAARGGLQGKRFPWGNEINHELANYQGNSASYSYDTSGYSVDTSHPQFAFGSIPYTSPVRFFAANGYGLYDMAGNVSEWCNDWFDDNYSSVGVIVNPTGPESGMLRVHRGGSWAQDAHRSRVTYRGATFATLELAAIGFRPARTVTAPSGFVWVEGGTLSTSNELNGTVVSSFYMGIYEVTWGEWQTVRTWAASNGYDIGSVGAGCADEHPVHTVNWFDVLKWSNAKSEMEGLTPVYTVSGNVYRTGEPDHTTISQNLSANGYRLPLEAEWEFAARGGNLTNDYTYAGSNDLNAVGWYSDNSGGAACDLWSGRGTWPVGQKAANELGLYDMSGNVWEWCWDRWSDTSSSRVNRGGSWYHFASLCTVSTRNYHDPANRFDFYGFRLARSSGN